MAKKATGSKKTSPKVVPKTEAKAKVAKGPNPLVGSVEEAKKLVEDRYKNPQHLEYCVLSNGHVFYGINRGAALGVARKFGLKYFDVKF